MDTKLLDEVIACLPKGKTHYRYFKGAYASRLLSMLLPERASVHQLKHTRFKRLLEHPTVKPIMADCGDGVLNTDRLNTVWQEPSQPFLLSVSRWGGKRDRSWFQTSRHGENLVLQLNLPAEHQRQYQAHIDSSGSETLNGANSSHPVQRPKDNPNFRETLAWSRIDLDFATNEALIEEVQSDGARYIAWWEQRHKRCGCDRCRQRLRYIHWMQSYREIWAEALLCASIEFIHNELGIERIFMHTARSGWQIKNMDKDWHAPRSLYSDLPKKFAFKQTWAAPEFLLTEKCYQRVIRKQPDIDFYQLSLREVLDVVRYTEQLPRYPERALRHPERALRHPEHQLSRDEHLLRHPERSEGSQPLNQTTGGHTCPAA